MAAKAQQDRFTKFLIILMALTGFALVVEPPIAVMAYNQLSHRVVVNSVEAQVNTCNKLNEALDATREGAYAAGDTSIAIVDKGIIARYRLAIKANPPDTPQAEEARRKSLAFLDAFSEETHDAVKAANKRVEAKTGHQDCEALRG